MKIIHRLAFRASSSQRQELESLGVRVPSGVAMPGGASLAAFDVVEDESWTKVRALLETWQVSEGVVRTEFSKGEIGAADWLELGAWHHGYPQPDEDNFGFREVTYDLADWCERCGIGKKQKAPFQMIGEPKWGRNGVMQLTWIYDELFATPHVWAGVFEPAGIGRRPVMDTRGHELTTVCAARHRR